MMDGEPWTRVVGFSDMRIFIPLWYSTIRTPLPIACRRNSQLPRGRRCRVSSSEIQVMLLRSTIPSSTQDLLPENDTRSHHVTIQTSKTSFGIAPEIKGVQLHQSYKDPSDNKPVISVRFKHEQDRRLILFVVVLLVPNRPSCSSLKRTGMIGLLSLGLL